MGKFRKLLGEFRQKATWGKSAMYIRERTQI